MSTETRHPNEDLARRQARWGFSFYSSGIVLAVGSFFYGAPSAASWAPPGLESAATFVIVAVPVAALTVGLVQLGRASMGAVRTAKAATLLLGLATLAGAAGMVAAFVPSLNWFLVGAALVPPLVIASAVCAIFGYASYAGVSSRRESGAPRPHGLLIAILALGMLVLIAIGVVELTVWMPQTLAPGYTVEEIYAALSAGDRVAGIASVLIWAGFWTLVTLAWAIGMTLLTRRAEVTTRTVVATAALLTGALLFLQGWAGFGLGMNVSDTLPPYTGGMSPAGLALAALGFGCSIAGVFVLVAPRHPMSVSVTAHS